MGRTFRASLWPVLFTCGAVALACEAQERDFDTAVTDCDSAECSDDATSEPDANPSAAGSDDGAMETDGSPSGSAAPGNPLPPATMVVSVPSAGPSGAVTSVTPGAAGNSGTGTGGTGPGGTGPAPDATEPGGAGAGNPAVEPDVAPSSSDTSPTVPAMTDEASGGEGPTPLPTEEPNNSGGEANAGGDGNTPGNGGAANGGEPGNGGNNGEPGNGGAPSVEPVGGCDEQLLHNANFDQGVTLWESESTWEGIDTIVPANDSGLLSHDVEPHSGGYLAWLGGTPDDPSFLHHISLTQGVAIPEDATAVTFSGVIQIHTLEPDPDVYDLVYAQLEIGDTTLFQFNIWTNVDAASGWVPFEFTTTDVSELYGRQVVFRLQSDTDHDLTTHFWFDSLRLEAPCQR